MPLELDELARRLGAGSGAVEQAWSDDIDPGPAVVREAAVLIPIVVRGARDHGVLLTRRSAELPHHPGQIAFPGGRQEDSDADSVAAALRESEEEIGLARSHVQILGQLGPYRTGTGFRVRPVVGAIPAGLSLTPDPREVDDIFEVPLAFMLDPANWRLETAEYRGRERRFYAIPHGERRIWGATAGMFVMLAGALFPDRRS